MKRAVIITLALLLWMPLLAQKRLTKEEFREKQKRFFTEYAKLTQAEAEKFFPLYFELQDSKKSINDEAWKLLRKTKKEELTEAQYREMMEGFYESRLTTDRLEKTYFDKYAKFLSYKKIFLLQKAEMRFHREMLKGARH